MATPKTKRKPAGKKPTAKKAATRTTFGPRTSGIKWVRGLLFPLLGILTFVALADYDPMQPGLVEQFQNSTDETIEPNLVGRFGRDLAWGLHFGIGFGSWALALALFWVGILYLSRRAHTVGLWKWGATLLFVAAVAGLATAVELFRNDGTELVDNVFPNGFGGAFGHYLYEVWLYPHLGSFGGNLTLLVILGVGGFGLFGGSFRRVGSWVGGRFAAWSATRAETADARREAKVLAREKRREEREAARLARKRAKSEAAAEALAKRKERATKRDAEKERLEAERVAATAPSPETEVKPGAISPPVADRPEPVASDLSGWGGGRGLLKVPGIGLQPTPRGESVPDGPEEGSNPRGTGPGNEASSADEPVPAPDEPPKNRQKPKPPPARTSADGPPAVAGLKIVQGEAVEKARVAPKKRAGSYRFPPLNLLADVPPRTVQPEDDHTVVAEALARTLDEFGVKATLGEVHTGPVITRYEVIPAPGVRVEKIANLEKNIGMSLRAQSVRILAPVPGKGVVGIEVPNRNPSAVFLREIAESRAWVDSKAEIPVVLGKDVSGKPIVTDLTKMPHLLIAGSTGSGKTVCINSIIASLLYHSSPSELRFIMVDPKIVEMQQYNSLPHMLIPVVTDPKRVPAALKWLIGEMEKRYHLFAKEGVRNIAGFNAKMAKDRAEKQRALELDGEMSPEERAALSEAEVPRDADVEFEEHPREKLPYIVCIVDELADLMMVAPADIETCIARLAQLARAAGIHLILATQRPSVNVITGVIKANLPCRIAFKVASKIDSRTILDAGGADALIGKGDMLFTPPGAHALVRAQGAFVSDDEINAIVDFLKVNGPPQILESVQQQIESDGEEGEGAIEGDFDDEMVPKAIEVIRSSRRASTSMLQRRLKIGYNRAARIMEILEDEGYVGPDNGSQPREILMDVD